MKLGITITTEEQKLFFYLIITSIGKNMEQLLLAYPDPGNTN